jgi:flagellar motor switch protein FliM
MSDTELSKVDPADTAGTRESMSFRAIQPVKIPWITKVEEHTSWPVLSQLAMVMTAGLALRGFKVGDLLGLEPGQIVTSTSSETEDIPLSVGGVQVAWSEFEVLDQRLSVRLTRLT